VRMHESPTCAHVSHRTSSLVSVAALLSSSPAAATATASPSLSDMSSSVRPPPRTCVCVCVCVCVYVCVSCVCVRACVREGSRAGVSARLHACVCVCVRACVPLPCLPVDVRSTQECTCRYCVVTKVSILSRCVLTLQAYNLYIYIYMYIHIYICCILHTRRECVHLGQPLEAVERREARRPRQPRPQQRVPGVAHAVLTAHERRERISEDGRGSITNSKELVRGKGAGRGGVRMIQGRLKEREKGCV
jgi:hypothetical protein